MKRIYVIAFLFCVTMLIWQIVSKKNENLILKERGKITFGNVLDFHDMSRFRYGVNYTFLVGNISYKEEDKITEIDYKYFGLFKGKIFPVIYDPENPSTSHIILTQSDFKFFNLTVPDTLKSIIDKTN